MKNSDVKLKTSPEVARIRKSCNLIEKIFLNLESFVVSGISTQDISDYCSEMIIKNNANLSLRGYRDYPASICTSVNSIAVHGLPGKYILKEGDIITVDIILDIDGWHGDGAYTYIVGKVGNDVLRLYKAAKESTYSGIKAARAGKRIGDIGSAISKTASRWGCSVLEELAGHGIGLGIHEDPVILPIGEVNLGLPIVPGMVFTIEPVLTLGNGKIKTLDDGWSIISTDGQFTAQFEHTIAIFSNHTEVLTSPELSFDFVI